MGGPELNPNRHRSEMPRSSGPCAWRCPHSSTLLAASLHGRGHGRNPPFGRIDNQGGSPFGELVTRLEPNTDAIADPRFERGAFVLRLVRRPPRGNLLFILGRLFCGQRLLPGQLLRPFHRRRGREIPHSLEVRVTVRRTRHRTLTGSGRGSEHEDGAPERQRAYMSKGSLSHENLLVGII